MYKKANDSGEEEYDVESRKYAYSKVVLWHFSLFKLMRNAGTWEEDGDDGDDISASIEDSFMYNGSGMDGEGEGHDTGDEMKMFAFAGVHIYDSMVTGVRVLMTSEMEKGGGERCVKDVGRALKKRNTD